MCAIHYFLAHCFGCPCGPLLGDICLIPVTNQSGAVEAGFGGNVQGQTSARVQCPCCQQDGKSALILWLTTIQQTDTGCSVWHRDMHREEHESNSRINYLLFSSSRKWNDLDLHLDGLKARVNSSCFPILKHPGWLRPAFQRAQLFQAHVKATIDSGPPKVHGFAGCLKIQLGPFGQRVGEDFGTLVHTHTNAHIFTVYIHRYSVWLECRTLFDH